MILRVVLIVLSCVWIPSVICQRIKPYKDFKVVEIKSGGVINWSDFLDAVDLDVLSRDGLLNSITGIINGDGMGLLYEAAHKYNATVKITLESLQEYIDSAYLDMDKRRTKRQAMPLYAAIRKFLNVPQSYAYQNKLVRTCNRRLRVIKKTIGYSYEKRPINIIQISNKKINPRRKTIFIEAGIHAREWLSHTTANNIIYQLACRPENEYLTRLFNWEILPILNPDGYAYTHAGNRMWRKNRQRNPRSTCVGTDLNRNFKAGYGRSGASTNACAQTYRGAYAQSAPETRILSNYILRNKGKIISYLSLHTFGQYIIIPWDYKNDRIPDYNNLKRIAQKTAAATGYRFTIQSGYAMYPAAGTSNDFMRERAHIARTFTWELMPTGHPGFVPRENLIPKYTSAIWKGVKSFAAAVSRDTNSKILLG